MLVIGNYNNSPVTVHFLVVQTQWPLAAVMALMLFCGFTFGLLAALIIGMKHSKTTTKPASNDDNMLQSQDNQIPESGNELVATPSKS